MLGSPAGAGGRAAGAGGGDDGANEGSSRRAFLSGSELPAREGAPAIAWMSLLSTSRTGLPMLSPSLEGAAVASGSESAPAASPPTRCLAASG